MSEKEDIPEGTGISEASEDERKFILNTGEIVAYLVRARLAGEDPGKLAYGFHRALADEILTACEEANEWQMPWEIQTASSRQIKSMPKSVSIASYYFGSPKNFDRF